MARQQITLTKITDLLNNFKNEIKEEIGRLKQELATKEEVNEVKDIVIGIRKELDTEHELRYRRLEMVAEQADKNTEDIVVIKQHLELASS